MYDSSQVLQARRGRLLVAPYGTTRPDDIGDLATLDAAFDNVGYTGDEDVMFDRGTKLESKKSWQSSVPFTAIQTDEEPIITVPSLLEWDTENLLLAFGGGDVVTATNGVSYVRPPGEVPELTALLVFKRATFTYAIGLKRCYVTEAPPVKLTRKDLSPLALKFAGLVPEDELDDDEDEPDPWVFLTDDASMPTGS